MKERKEGGGREGLEDLFVILELARNFDVNVIIFRDFFAISEINKIIIIRVSAQPSGVDQPSTFSANSVSFPLFFAFLRIFISHESRHI